VISNAKAREKQEEAFAYLSRLTEALKCASVVEVPGVKYELNSPTSPPKTIFMIGKG
jgi:hypothetical protein